MRKRIAILAIATAIGILLLFYSANVGYAIGSVWFGDRATEPWHMNNYIVIDAKQAYTYFGLTSLAIGGLATGLTAPVFFTSAKPKRYLIALAAFFFVAIILTGLGFNTLDFMLGVFYWTNMKEPPPVQVPVIGPMNAWNYYFYMFVVPLWLSGFLIGIGASVYMFSRLGKGNETTQKQLQLKKQLRYRVVYSNGTEHE